ncbi:hypothetical protein CEXT_575761 [Caerostris extrusa]|uniref:Uncharacterized protein n=1 Tax=Caerostris extrusa TaxID=172846 RepID=A0AAV4M3K9_CAEEX|nr:hypothetical protein CEXT_575761 [Caerostris extrusa]
MEGLSNTLPLEEDNILEEELPSVDDILEYELMLFLAKKRFRRKRFRELSTQNITSLHEACFQNQVDCAEKLLNSELINQGTVNAVIHHRTALCDACEVGSSACTELLCKRGADVNPLPRCWSPLHIACLNKHVQCAEILLKYGAHVKYYEEI